MAAHDSGGLWPQDECELAKKSPGRSSFGMGVASVKASTRSGLRTPHVIDVEFQNVIPLLSFVQQV